jgi:hypothetical protein
VVLVVLAATLVGQEAEEAVQVAAVWVEEAQPVGEQAELQEGLAKPKKPYLGRLTNSRP